jgi:hypothetical protein
MLHRPFSAHRRIIVKSYRCTVTALGLAALLLPLPAVAGVSRSQLCLADKLMASANYEQCMLASESLFAKTGNPARRDELQADCGSKLAKAWDRTDRAYQGECPRTDDLLDVQTLLGQCAATAAGAVPPRFSDNGDGTISDHLTHLVWEAKTGTPGDPPNPADVHDVNRVFSWALAAPWSRDGTAFTDFIDVLNGAPGFAGRNDWRLPTAEELGGGTTNPLEGGLVNRYVPGCGTVPYPSCIAQVFEPSALIEYWTDSTYTVDPEPRSAWYVNFRFRTAGQGSKTEERAVRAVAGDS